MRIIEEQIIIDVVKNLFIEANFSIPCDIMNRLKSEKEKQNSELSKSVVDIIIKNNEIANQKKCAICQDTGMAIVFVKIGTDVHINTNKSLQNLFDEGVRKA